MLEERVSEAIYNMNDFDLICVWNDFCDKTYHKEDKVYCMSELDSYFENVPFSTAFNTLLLEEFNPNDYYFGLDYNGKLISSCTYDVFKIDMYLDDLISFICIERDNLGDESLREIL